MPFSLKARSSENVYVIVGTGSFNVGEGAKGLEAALELGAREFSRFVINLSDVDRVDSTGLGLLVRYADRMGRRGGGVRLAAAPKFVVTLLDLTKLSGLLPNYPTEEEAILSFDEGTKVSPLD